MSVAVSVSVAISLELRVFTALTSKLWLPPISQSTDTDTGTFVEVEVHFADLFCVDATDQ